jgi:hypothetical protein
MCVCVCVREREREWVGVCVGGGGLSGVEVNEPDIRWFEVRIPTPKKLFSWNHCFLENKTISNCFPHCYKLHRYGAGKQSIHDNKKVQLTKK